MLNGWEAHEWSGWYSDYKNINRSLTWTSCFRQTRWLFFFVAASTAAETWPKPRNPFHANVWLNQSAIISGQPVNLLSVPVSKRALHTINMMSPDLFTDRRHHPRHYHTTPIRDACIIITIRTHIFYFSALWRLFDTLTLRQSNLRLHKGAQSHCHAGNEENSMHCTDQWVMKSDCLH